MEVGILGAGGHARSVYDCLMLSTEGDALVRFYDDRYPEIEHLEDRPVVGPIDQAFREGEPDHMFVAIGDNGVRCRLTRRLEDLGRTLLTIRHPRAVVSPRAEIGAGTVSIPGSVVNAGARVGEGVIINTLASVGHDCVVESFVQIASGTNLGGGARICQGAFLGLGVKVGPNVTIGEWCVVGAGSVVLRDLPPRTFCHGSPARVVRELTDEELDDCRTCG